MTRYETSVLVPLAADDTFALITQPERLRRWQAITARVELRAGGEYRWTIIPGQSVRGTFTEIEPGKRVAFTWGWEGSTDLPPGASTVTITLEPTAAGTLVRLVHEGLTDEQAASHSEGWSHYAGRLAEAGASGDAGPDDWAAVPSDTDAIRSAEATLAICLRALRDTTAADLSRATPCTEFNVGQLADHLAGSIAFFGAAAGAQCDDDKQADLEGRIANLAQAALEAWSRRGLEGQVKVGGNQMPANLALGILSVEFLVHAWDFGQALDRQVAVPDQLAEHVMDIAETIITADVRKTGSFAEAIPVGPDARILDRLVAFTGRAG